MLIWAIELLRFDFLSETHLERFFRPMRFEASSSCGTTPMHRQKQGYLTAEFTNRSYGSQQVTEILSAVQVLVVTKGM